MVEVTFVHSGREGGPTRVAEPQEAVLLGAHSDGGRHHGVFEVLPEVKQTIEAKERCQGQLCKKQQQQRIPSL